MTDFLRRAADLDAADPLVGFASEFHVPDGVIYLDGNSLGLMPRHVPARLAEVATGEWAEGLIRSWTSAGWFTLPMQVGDRIAPLIGAAPGDVAVGDSTSVNLFKGLAAALHLRHGRRVILADAANFPTDSYMAQGLAGLVPGVSVRYVEPGQSVNDALGPDVAVLLLSHVDYRTSLVQDMAAVTATAHAHGALVLWDLSHTTGAVHCDLTAADADMAVGCTYKYLNGGPGAPAFMWVHPRFAADVQQPLSGWMGHAAPFQFTRDYAPAPGARRLVCGTPQVLSLSALDSALAIWARVDRAALFAKSRAMTRFFIEAVETSCARHGLVLVGPRDPQRRGSHVSFDYAHGYEVVQALIARGVIGDFRAPAAMRFGFAPLYLSFTQVAQAVEHLRDVLDTRAWDDDRFRTRAAVT
ncbi:MAG: kynureninase [Vicinamibacterales bacterium]